MGVILIIGITKLWPLAMGGLLLWLTFNALGYKIGPAPVVKGSKWITILMLTAGISALLNSTWMLMGQWLLSAILLYVAAISLPRSVRLSIPIAVMTIVALSIGTYEYLSSATRINGVAVNASMLGMMGVAIPGFAGSAVSGLSLSRTALVGYAVWFVLRPSKRTVSWMLLGIVVSFGIGCLVTPERYTFGGAQTATDLRVATINGTSMETPEPGPEPDLQWLGTGFNGFLEKTGRAQPHNVIAIIVWELGVLAVPFWVGVLGLWWQSRNWYVLAVVGVTGMFIDEWYNTVEGLFMVVTMGVVTRSWASPVDNWRGFGRISRERFSYLAKGKLCLIQKRSRLR